MPMFATSHYQTEIDEYISMGFSTKAIAAKLNIPEKILIRNLEERKAARNEWQQKVNEKYKNTMYE